MLDCSCTACYVTAFCGSSLIRRPGLFLQLVDCLASRARACHLSLQPAADLHPVSLAASARQSRKFQPLLPEFREIRYMPSSFQPDKSCKVLLSHVVSGKRESAKIRQVTPALPPKARSRSRPCILTRMSGHDLPLTSEADTGPDLTCQTGVKSLPSTSEADTGPDLTCRAESSSAIAGPPHSECAVRVGFWFSPKEHMERARQLAHQMDSANPIAPETLEVLDEYMTASPAELALKRRLALLKVKLLVRSLERRKSNCMPHSHRGIKRLWPPRKSLLGKGCLKNSSMTILRQRSS